MNKGSNSIVKMIFGIILFFAIVGSFSLFMGLNSSDTTISYQELQKKIENDEVKELNIQPSNGVYKVTGTLKKVEDEKLEKPLASTIPGQDNIYGEVIKTIEENNVPVKYIEEAHTTPMQGFIMQIIFIGLMFMGMSFLFRKVAGGKGGPMGVGEHKANKINNSKITFDDVIGLKEEKQELVEIIDFLKNPSKYHEMGAKIPNGILLEGPPGTGKTLMAKAVAGEANVPFFSISGSDFIEMFAGVGASRVRSLFKDAKKEERAIIFIDEIDAIGKRESSGNGSDKESNQTINALLVELDGFASEKGGIIIIGATNRADKLDKALLRPGRFDRKVLVGLPNLKEREAMLNYHAAKRKINPEITFSELAKVTTGMSGAELEAVINEAAILTVRENRKQIEKEDLVEAVDRVQMGPAKVSNKYSKRDKDIVSYHESGHAIIGLELENAMQVQKITIIPRRNAGGYVAFTPKDDEKFQTKRQLEEQIIGLLGGRAAEEIFLNEMSIGAHDDLERATAIARAMVTEYGMSDLGLYQYEGNYYRQNPYAMRQYSEEVASKIDSEISRILSVAHTRAREIIMARADDMHLLAKTIREVEVLEREQIMYLLKHGTLEVKAEDAEEPVTN